MTAGLSCPACGYRLGAPGSKSLERCPRCGTPFGNEPTKGPESSSPKRPGPTAGDLADLEFSDIAASGAVIQDDGRQTSPRQRESSAKEITDRQGLDSQGEKLVIQEHLAAMPRPSVAIHVKGSVPPKEVARSTFRQLLSTFGGVALACAVFLLWVIYDRSSRPAPAPSSSETDAILSQAVTSFQRGDRDTARSLVEEALQQNPKSQLAKNLAQLFKEPK